MAVPFSYSLRNLWTRRTTTILTVAGMALVVFVFATILMLAEGLERTLVETGSADNVVVIRKGSASEVMSGVERAQAAVVEVQPEVSVGRDGRKLLAKEIVVLIALTKRGNGKASNVVLRGIGPASLELRPGPPGGGATSRLGSSEVMAGRNVDGLPGRRAERAGLLWPARLAGRDLRCGQHRLQPEIWGTRTSSCRLPPARLLLRPLQASYPRDFRPRRRA